MAGSPRYIPCMSVSFKAACIQNCATPDVAHNLEVTLRLTREAAAAGADLVCLPEYFSGVETRDGLFHPAAFPEDSHPAIAAFRAAARELGVWLHLGSLGVGSPGERVKNRGYVLTPKGEIAARYDKIHLFDVDLSGSGGGVFAESAKYAPGSEVVVAKTPFGGVGLSVCYDLRFPELYRTLAQQGADWIVVPSAFAPQTGKDHWEVLLRARAIETGCYVIAAAQCGTHAEDRKTYGHSLIVDPWGEVLADGGEQVGVITAEIDAARVAEARRKIPALRHDQPVNLAAGKAPGSRAAE